MDRRIEKAASQTWASHLTWLRYLLLIVFAHIPHIIGPAHEGATADWSPLGMKALAAADWDTVDWVAEGNAATHVALNWMMENFHNDVEHLWAGFYHSLGIDPSEEIGLME